MSNLPGQSVDPVNVVSVSVIPEAPTLQLGNLSTIALFSQDAPSGWSVGQTYQIYKNPSVVGVDFGVNSNAYAIAQGLFAQNPNVLANSGYLVIIPRLTSPSLESVRDAITRTKNLVFYFGILIDEEMASQPTEFAALAAMVQTLDKMFFYTSSNIADLQPGSMLDLLRSGNLHNTRGFYHGNELLNGALVQQTQIFSGAYAGRGLSVDFGGSRTTLTMNLKSMSIIQPDQTIGDGQLALAQTAGIDVYVGIGNIAEMLTSGANSYFDAIQIQFWLKSALQVAGLNFLAGTSTKIPQTEEGMNGLKDAYAKICTQGVVNGAIAPGAWSSPTIFGNQADLYRNIAAIGYYIFSTPVALQNQVDRVNRKAPLVQIGVKLAGAIHSSNVIVQLNA